MATLKRFKANTTKINNGEWVRPGEQFGDIEIRTKGYTDAYHDARQAKMRRAAQRYGGDVLRIPNAEVRDILRTLIIEHCLLGVRNLQDQDGNEVSIEDFKNYVQEDCYQDLYNACLNAVEIITNEREADVSDAKKSSAKPSP